MLRELFPSKWAIAAGLGCAILIPSTIGLSYKYGIERHDRKQVESKLETETDKKDTAERKLASCGTQLSGATASVKLQNDRISELLAAQTRLRQAAEARLRSEQAQTRRAEAQRQTLLRQQMLEGESACDAAWRIHRENVQ